MSLSYYFNLKRERFYVIFKSYFEFLIPLYGSIVLFYCWDYKTFYNLLHLKKILMTVIHVHIFPFQHEKRIYMILNLNEYHYYEIFILYVV